MGTESASATEIQGWLVNAIAKRLELEPSAIDIAAPVKNFGLDSWEAVELGGELEEWLGVELEATIFWDHPTISAIAQHLSEKVKGAG